MENDGVLSEKEVQKKPENSPYVQLVLPGFEELVEGFSPMEIMTWAQSVVQQGRVSARSQES